MPREDRLKFIKELEKNTNTKIICYLTGDRPKLETKIAFDAIPLLYEHLRAMEKLKILDYSFTASVV